MRLVLAASCGDDLAEGFTAGSHPVLPLSGGLVGSLQGRWISHSAPIHFQVWRSPWIGNVSSVDDETPFSPSGGGEAVEVEALQGLEDLGMSYFLATP